MKEENKITSIRCYDTDNDVYICFVLDEEHKLPKREWVKMKLLKHIQQKKTY